MTSISHTGAAAEVQAAPKAKTRNPSLDRARTFLTLVVLLHHAVIPYTYFGHTDPKSFFGFDMIVLATDSFFMAMFFFLSGLFVWPGIARKGPLNYLSRSPAPARPALRDLRVHGHSARLLRHLAAAASRNRLLGILVEDGHVRALAERPDLVPLGAARLRSDRLPAVPAVTQHARSDQSPLAARLAAGRPVFFAVMLAGHRRVLHSRRWSTSDRAAGSSSGRSRSSRPRAALCHLLLFRRRHRRCEFGSRLLAADGRMAKVQLGLDGR